MFLRLQFETPLTGELSINRRCKERGKKKKREREREREERRTTEQRAGGWRKKEEEGEGKKGEK